MKTLKLLGTSMITATLLLSGCGSTEAGGESGTDITVERGPVLAARVTDANGQAATALGNGRYRFTETPAYPLQAREGVIDANRNGQIDGEDGVQTFPLRTRSGEHVTLLTTLMEDETVKTALMDALEMTEEELSALPGESAAVAAATNLLYQLALAGGESNLTQALNAQVILANREALAQRIQAYQAAGNGWGAMAVDDENTTIGAHGKRLGSEQANKYNGGGLASGTGIDFSLYPLAELTDAQRESLSFMWEEEKMARDLYLAFDAAFDVNPFANIARSEETHMEMVEALLVRYDMNTTGTEEGNFTLPVIQGLYDDLLALGAPGTVEALQVGCMVEVTDIDDLTAQIEGAPEEMAAVYRRLMEGSYNHYAAFNSALVAQGVEEGCCSAGEAYCKTGEYPEADRGGNGYMGGRN